jgi:Chlorophyll A-B binding protein
LADVVVAQTGGTGTNAAAAAAFDAGGLRRRSIALSYLYAHLLLALVTSALYAQIHRDPLGFLDGADEAKFTKLRYAEVKHGRIAMLAIVGHMVRTRIGWTGLIKCTAN